MSFAKPSFLKNHFSKTSFLKTEFFPELVLRKLSFSNLLVRGLGAYREEPWGDLASLHHNHHKIRYPF